jgi:hypothetical protein
MSQLVNNIISFQKSLTIEAQEKMLVKEQNLWLFKGTLSRDLCTLVSSIKQLLVPLDMSRKDQEKLLDDKKPETKIP